jgi:hypothetical protein
VLPLLRARVGVLDAHLGDGHLGHVDSFFTPTEMLALAREAGFKKVQHVSAAILTERYFAGRTDGLRPPNNSGELLVAIA